MESQVLIPLSIQIKTGERSLMVMGSQVFIPLSIQIKTRESSLMVMEAIFRLNLLVKEGGF
jgi:hypothetical protein